MNRSIANRAFAVGLLVAVAGAIFLVAFTFFKKGGYADSDTYPVYAYFEDATGLTWKSRVQIAGIQVGEVEKITLEANRARLDLRIKKEIDLRADACLTKRYPSTLLPDALLDAVPGTSKAPSLKDKPPAEREVKCVNEATSVGKLLDSMSKISTDVQGVTRELSQMVAGSQGSIKQIIENLSRVTARLGDTVDSETNRVERILSNTESFTGTLSQVAVADKDRYRAIAENLADATGRLNKLLESAQGIVGDTKEGDLKGSVADVRQSLARLNSSMEQIQKIATDVSQGKGVAGKLLADERLGNKLSNTLESVSEYVDRLYQLQLQVHLRSEWLLNQTGAKTYAGIRLLPRPDKYYLFEVVSDPRGVNTQTVSKVTTGAGTTTTTTTLNEQRYLFSLQFAKRYGPATFRIGIIESSGGAGIDLHLLDDRLTLSTSMYQFSRPDTNVFPRAKVAIDYAFLRYFYVTTGTDDFLNAWRGGHYPGGPKFAIGRDVFFGGGIVFTDDDLKAVVSLVGGAASGAVK